MFRIDKKSWYIIIVAITVLLFVSIALLFIRNIVGESTISSEQMFVHPNQNRIIMNEEHAGIVFDLLQEEEIDGSISLWVLESEWNGELFFESSQDIFTVYIENNSMNPVNLILKVFYNYEEAIFQPVATENKVTELIIKLESAHYAKIPMRLHLEDVSMETLSKLTIGIFFDPEYYYANNEEFVHSFYSGMVLNFDINYGYNNELYLESAFFEVSAESEFGGATIDSNPIPPGDGSLRFFPNTLIAKAGEEVELTLFANASTNEDVPTKDYLVIVMIDWHQVSVSDNYYILVDSENRERSMGQHIHFTVIAPHEPGFYEFLAFLILNPTHRNLGSGFVPQEIISRFTLEVVE